MFEIGIFCVIFLAVAYWAVLWLMGRREDVLHGEFVKSEPHAESGCYGVGSNMPFAVCERTRRNPKAASRLCRSRRGSAKLPVPKS